MAKTNRLSRPRSKGQGNKEARMNGDKLVHCRKCENITAHELLDAYMVRCLRCGSVKDLKNPHVVEAEIVTHGDPKRA